MDHLTFDKGFWKSFIWFLVIALLICCLPWLLAKHSWIDFSTTGEIGDTIGGIMGPFIAIAAAGLAQQEITNGLRYDGRNSYLG